MSALVLIVDEDPKRLDQLRRLVEREGPEALTASDAREAMRLFVRREPDFTLLQANRSDDLGTILCRDMKTLRVGRRRWVGVIGPRTRRSEAFDAGCDAFVARQRGDQALQRTVRGFSASRRPTRTIGEIEVGP